MTGSTCRRCGTEPRAGARFCDACGSLIVALDTPAEHKLVTVLFADVVRSMIWPRSWIPSDCATSWVISSTRAASSNATAARSTIHRRRHHGVVRCAGHVRGSRGTRMRGGAGNSTGGGAARRRHSGQARPRTRFRVGLDSGDVVVGQIGSTSTVYTAIGAHVGMAQRMESVAPPGGVMLSETTSRLVEHAAVLGAVEMVTVKGAATPVRARRLRAMSATRTLAGRREATLIGRNRERELPSQTCSTKRSAHEVVSSECPGLLVSARAGSAAIWSPPPARCRW